MSFYTRVGALVASLMLPMIILAQQPQTKATTETASQEKNPTSSTVADSQCCICPIYRWMEYPTYSCYYSKKCDNGIITYVPLYIPDIGPYPNMSCPGCGS